MYFSKAKLGEEGLDGEGGMRGLDPGCCFPADCSRTSTSQATSYLWKQRGPNLNALQPQPLSEERSSQHPHPHFWESESSFANCDLLTCVSKLFRTLLALVFSEKVRKWQCDSVSYTISSCSTDTPPVPHTCVCFHQEKHIFKPFRIFGGQWKRTVPIQILVTFDSAHICWWQFEAWEARLGMRGEFKGKQRQVNDEIH